MTNESPERKRSGKGEFYLADITEAKKYEK